MKHISCVLCGKDETKKIADGYDRYVGVDKTLFDLVKCTSCGLVYINPQPTPQELAKYYPLNYPPFIKKEGAINKTSHDTSIKTVLDFGCGSGLNLLSIREKYPL